MPRQVASKIENSFVKGLITEASGLNFPENACTETYDCIFNLDGTVSRRLGFEFEQNYTKKTVTKTDKAIVTYLWRNVSGDGDVTLLVAQIGETLYFWDATTVSVSSGAITDTVSLNDFDVAGAPDVSTVECQFAAGHQKLLVTHPYCDPFYVTYDSTGPTLTGTAITIKIRDFRGDKNDSYGVAERPTSTLAALGVAHLYNLYNQGWRTPGSNATANLTTWDTNLTTMPSNADIMWVFKDSNEAFQTNLADKFMTGNTAAPKGHFILDAFDENRNTVATADIVTEGGGTGVGGGADFAGAEARTTSYWRPSCGAFYAGRAFYSGVNYPDYTGKIYFSQILENDDEYGLCYQKNDPTSENLFDLAPADGGVISIPEAGQIIKLFPMAGVLLVFAVNGIWSVSGSTGIGFTANDYTVQKMSSITAISASSFVDVAGVPCWWNYDGIYIMSPQQGGGVAPVSITVGTVQAFMDEVPASAKLHAKGYFNLVDGIIQWIYRVTNANTVGQIYEYTHTISYNIHTKAFYPWTIPTISASTDVAINSITVLEGSHGSIGIDNVIDASANNVVDAAANQVVVFSSSAAGGGTTPTFKYLVSFEESGNDKFTFAEARNDGYVDWELQSGGIAYTSYLVSGFQVHGGADKRFQPIWVTLYSDTTELPTSYTFKGRWDFANTNDVHRWSIVQTVSHTDDSYDVQTKKLKIRGHGKCLQFQVSSVAGTAFNILGWAQYEAINQVP